MINWIYQQYIVSTYASNSDLICVSHFLALSLSLFIEYKRAMHRFERYKKGEIYDKVKI